MTKVIKFSKEKIEVYAKESTWINDNYKKTHTYNVKNFKVINNDALKDWAEEIFKRKIITTLNIKCSFFDIFKEFFSFFITNKWYCKISSIIDIINAAHMKNSSFQSSYR